MKPLVALLLVLAAEQPADAPVEQTKKNIKVLKGLPTSQLIPLMAFMSNSLGVNCEHCHTKEYESDEKEAKGVARTMIVMVRDINERHFGGETAITCTTCHRGGIRPRTTPRIADAFFNAPPAPPKQQQTLPPVTAIVEKYLKATKPLGDVHGTITRIDGVSAPFTLHDGEVKTELEYPAEANDALQPVALNRERLAAIGIETIRGHEAYVLEQRHDRLYIDTQSGALLRWHRETAVDLGELPDETDYEGETITWSRGDTRLVFKIVP